MNSNHFSSTNHNYSNDEKKFTERFLSYWINFIKYNDPNYSVDDDDLENWKPFGSKHSSKHSVNYLKFGQDNIELIKGFEDHKCNFWESISQLDSKSN